MAKVRKEKKVRGKKGLAVKRVDMPPVDGVSVLEYTRQCMQRYGESVIEDRALPDYRDGLKPVHRKILWAAHKMGLTPGSVPKKSARLVGDVIGKYSPHGDSGAYGAMITMVNSYMPTLTGQGNWGSSTDGAAAYRYTEVKLSSYGSVNFFGSDYVAVTKMVPNFDGSEIEPLVLPSLLPSLLLNGSFGIGVGITCNIPPFEAKGVLELVRLVLRNEVVDSGTCMKHLRANYRQYEGKGAHFYVGDKDSRIALRNFYKTGEGSAYLIPEFEVDAKNRLIKIWGLPPNLNPLKALEKSMTDPRVSMAENAASKDDPLLYEIQLKAGIGTNIVGQVADEIIDKFWTTKQNYKFNVTKRYIADEDLHTRAKFMHHDMVSFLKSWVKWRKALEIRTLKNRNKVLAVSLELQQLMMLASKNIDIIMAALKRKDTETYLEKALKITPKQVDIILGRQIRTLKALERSKIQERIDDLTKQIDQITKWLKAPSKKILADLDALEKVL